MSALKILIVEDSEIASDILTQALESDSKLRVVGVARNGREALEMLPGLTPDLITMDVWMPVMDGFETVERVMADYPTPILVITSSSLKADVQLSMRMLEAGALDVIEKPSLTDEAHWARQQQELVAKVKLLAGVKVITHLRGRRNQRQKTDKGPISPAPASENAVPSNPIPNSTFFKKPDSKAPEDRLNTPPAIRPRIEPALTPSPRANDQPIRLEAIKATFPANPFYNIIAIASSTGGPTALLRILQALPANLPCGILIVQHISDGFTQGLVDWLQREIALKIRMAKNGDRIAPGLVLIAPDGRDMLVKADGTITTTREGISITRPNADVLMRSVAQVFGAHAIGLVLTGMGSDGANGLRAMLKSGAYTLAQDEASSLIYGMPKAAADLGATCETVALGNIASRLVQLLQRPNDSANGGRGL